MSIYTEASNEELAEMLRDSYRELSPQFILEVMAESLARLLILSTRGKEELTNA